MRIIAGTKRRMKLLSPKTAQSRPITDRVKESLFDVLFNYGVPKGQRVADLFCGVGSLGLEALSRGAKSVTFVERDSGIVATLKRNIEKAGFVKESNVIRADAFKVGAPACPEARTYGLVFVDPPYADTRDVGPRSPLGKLLRALEGQVAPKGLVVVRTQRDTTLLENYGRFNMLQRRLWGTMAVGILEYASR